MDLDQNCHELASLYDRLVLRKFSSLLRYWLLLVVTHVWVKNRPTEFGKRMLKTKTELLKTQSSSLSEIRISPILPCFCLNCHHTKCNILYYQDKILNRDSLNMKTVFLHIGYQ